MANTEHIAWIRIAGNPLYAHQIIGITGLGEPLFEQSLSGLLSLYGAFEAHLPEGKLEPWRFGQVSVNQQLHHVVSMGNQLFTSSKTADDAGSDIRILPITRQMDPNTHVQAAKGELIFFALTITHSLNAFRKVAIHKPERGADMGYIEDRISQVRRVYIYALLKMLTTLHRNFTPTGLGKVRDGDIVELQFTMQTTFIHARDCHRLRPTLRAIARLDSSVREVNTCNIRHICPAKLENTDCLATSASQ